MRCMQLQLLRGVIKTKGCSNTQSLLADLARAADAEKTTNVLSCARVSAACHNPPFLLTWPAAFPVHTSVATISEAPALAPACTVSLPRVDRDSCGRDALQQKPRGRETSTALYGDTGRSALRCMQCATCSHPAALPVPACQGHAGSAKCPSG